MSILKPVGVFWDIENCCVPKGKSALKIIERIRERFFTNCREAEFICVCDINKESDNTIKDLNDGQINVVHINATAKNAADDKIRQSLRRFSDSHPPGTKVVLISSDVNFAAELSDLRHRKRYEVILIHKNQVSDALLLCATGHYSYEDLIKDLPDRPGYKEATECVLVVYGYNKEDPLDKVRAILKMHSNNCGGKVISIGPLFAVLKFETPELLDRAKKRMNGEDVYGRKITVCLPEETTFYNTIRKLTASHMSRRQESPSPQRRPPRERLGSRSYTPDGQERGYNNCNYGNMYFQPYEQYYNYYRGSQDEGDGYQFDPSFKTPVCPVQRSSPSGQSPGANNQALSPSHTFTLPNSNSERYYDKSSPGDTGPSNDPKFLETAEPPRFVMGDLSNADSSSGQPITVFKRADTGKKSLKDIPIPSFGFSTIPPPSLPVSVTSSNKSTSLDPAAVSFDPIKLIETASQEMMAFKSSASNTANTLSSSTPVSHPGAQSRHKNYPGIINGYQSTVASQWADKSARSQTSGDSAFTKLLSATAQYTDYAAYHHQHHQSRSSSVPLHTQAIDSRTIEDEICRLHGYPPPNINPHRSHSQEAGLFKKPASPHRQFKYHGSSNYYLDTSPASRGHRASNSFSSDGEDRAQSPSNHAGNSGPRPRLSSYPTSLSRETGLASNVGQAQSPMTGTPEPRVKLKQHGSSLYRVPTPNEMGDPSTDFIYPDFDITRCDPYVVLIVSNLDYNIHPREWRKIIYATFQPHVKILSIQVHLQADNTSVATVRLPTEQDARFAIAQFHRRKIGDKRIDVQFKSDCSESPAESLRTDTIALLMEAKDNKLALSQLIDLFDKRFHKTVSVSDVYTLRDTIHIQETVEAGRWVHLQPGMQRSPTLIQMVEGEIPEVLEQPVCTIHCAEGSLHYTAVMNTCMLDNVQILRKHFSPQLHSLLLSHNGYIPLMSFPACYSAEFSALPIAKDGIPLEHVISCVPGVEIYMSKVGVKVIQFQENRDQFYDLMKGTSWQELGKLSRDVMELLRTQSTCTMPMSKFILAYHHYFGRQCRVADYGYTKLQELFEAIPHAIQILGTGDRKTIALSPRAQLKRFTTDIIKVIKALPAKQIMLDDFPRAYEQVMGKPMYLPHYGVAFMEDVFMDIPTTTIIIIEESNHTLLALPRRDQTPEEVERTKQFALEVVDLLKHNPQCHMPFNKFIPAYHHHFGHQCRVADYGFAKLTDLFEAIAHVVELEVINGQEFASLVREMTISRLGLQVMQLLMDESGGSLPMTMMELCMRYESLYGTTCNIERIKEELVDYVQIDDGSIRLTSQQMLGRNLGLLLLHTERIPMNELSGLYRQRFGVELSPALYSFPSLYQLLLSFPHILDVRGKPHKYIQLSGMLSAPGTIPLTHVDISPNQFESTSSETQAQASIPVPDSGEVGSSPAFHLLRHASQLWDTNMAQQPTSTTSEDHNVSPITSTHIVQLLKREQSDSNSPTSSVAKTVTTTSTNGSGTVENTVIVFKQLKISPNGVPEAWQMKAGGNKTNMADPGSTMIHGNLGKLMESLDSGQHVERSDSCGVSYGYLSERGDSSTSESKSKDFSLSSFTEGESKDIIFIAEPRLDKSSAHSNRSSSPCTTSPVKQKPKKRIAANFNLSLN